MNTHYLILILHILSALLWVTTYTYRLVCYMSKIIKGKYMYALVSAYNSYKTLEIALLTILIASGIVLVLLSEVPANEWLLFDSTAQRSVSVKLVLLVLIAIFRWSIQYSIMPKLKSGETNVLPLIYHAVIITLLSVLLLLSSFAL